MRSSQWGRQAELNFHSQSLRIPTERHFIRRQYWQRFLKREFYIKSVQEKQRVVWVDRSTSNGSIWCFSVHGSPLKRCWITSIDWSEMSRCQKILIEWSSLSPLGAICVKTPSLKEVCAQRRHKMTLNDTSVVTGPKKEKKLTSPHARSPSGPYFHASSKVTKTWESKTCGSQDFISDGCVT